MTARVLVCDNEPAMRALVRAALAPGGYEIAEARDGLESVERARQVNPDVVVLDMSMPGRPGLEVLDELRRDPELAQARVVVLTARTQEEDRRAATRAGADVYLTKPFSPSELAATVERLLGAGP
jgi:CheY-like chemotaxis protein